MFWSQSVLDIPPTIRMLHRNLACYEGQDHFRDLPQLEELKEDYLTDHLCEQDSDFILVFEKYYYWFTQNPIDKSWLVQKYSQKDIEFFLD